MLDTRQSKGNGKEAVLSCKALAVAMGCAIKERWGTGKMAAIDCTDCITEKGEKLVIGPDLMGCGMIGSGLLHVACVEWWGHKNSNHLSKIPGFVSQRNKMRNCDIPGYCIR
jgi:hypothetical protein